MYRCPWETKTNKHLRQCQCVIPKLYYHLIYFNWFWYVAISSDQNWWFFAFTEETGDGETANNREKHGALNTHQEISFKLPSPPTDLNCLINLSWFLQTFKRCIIRTLFFLIFPSYLRNSIVSLGTCLLFQVNVLASTYFFPTVKKLMCLSNIEQDCFSDMKISYYVSDAILPFTCSECVNWLQLVMMHCGGINHVILGSSSFCLVKVLIP